MDFTFGIITNGNNDNFIKQIILDIRTLNIKNYEIIIVGGQNVYDEKIIHIPFDENIKKMWITKKKNIITKEASFENIVYMHDYITLLSNWYEGFLKFGNDFKVCMTKISNTDGTRYRDWTLWGNDVNKIIIRNELLIPYNMTHLSKYMYFSGAYWVAKKDVMIEFPLDESLSWGEGEDVKWSFEVRNKYDFSINENSTAKLLKYKDKIFNYASQNTIEILKNMK